MRSAAASAVAEDIEDDLSATWNTAQAVMADEGTGPELLLEGPNAEELAWIDWKRNAHSIFRHRSMQL